MAKVIKKSIKGPRKSKFQFDEVSVDLTDRQKLFCMEYVRCQFNGTQAATNAGYAKNSACAQASYLLMNPDIQKLISELKKDIGLQLGISAYQIAMEYAKIGFSDIRDIFDSKGNLIKIKAFSVKAAGNVSSVEVSELMVDGVSVGVTKKIRMYDKVKALDNLAKMLGVDGVTKIANTDPSGNDIVLLPKKDLHD